jgi:hypothetical protein
MRTRELATISSLLCALALVCASAEATADSPREIRYETIHEEIVPSPSLLAGGLTTLVLSYGPSVVVASTSDRAEDHHLFVPIAGPWIDVGNRGDCGGMTGRSCDTETTYKVLLVVDGVAQGLATLTVLDAFITPEPRIVTRTVGIDAPRLTLRPARLGAGYGVVATARF